MALKFASEKDSQEFESLYQNKKFNQLEPDSCQVATLAAATISLEKGGSSNSSDDEKPFDLEKIRSPEVLFQAQAEEQSNCPICLESLHSAQTSALLVGESGRQMKHEKMRGGE